VTVSSSGPAAVSFGERLEHLASVAPQRPVVIVARADGSTTTTTMFDLVVMARRAARLLADKGVGRESTVAVGLGRTSEHLAWSVGAWSLGAAVLPMNPELPDYERARVLGVSQPAAVIAAGWENVDALAPDLVHSGDASLRLAPTIPTVGKVMATGGSTGTPKLIVIPEPWAFIPGQPRNGHLTKLPPGRTQLVTGPLHHNSPFLNAYIGLFQEQTLVMMERFDPEVAVELMGRFDVAYLAVVPAVLRRLLASARKRPDCLAQVQSIFHTGAPCPPWLKQAWIDLVGPEHVHEMYGSTEAFGNTAITGTEWLEHRGSVGQPKDCEIKILDDLGEPLGAGEVGEIFMRDTSGAGRFRYVGGKTDIRPDGFATTGDFGSMDLDGYVYLADRRTDIIITGGSNVYPAEVEGVLLEHPGVADAVVVGQPDPTWGRRVHAVVERGPGLLVSAEELIRFCRERIAKYKAPKTVEFVASLPREESGKIRRSALVVGANPSSPVDPSHSEDKVADV
jgi:bile acid-coenzyme A ligase